MLFQLVDLVIHSYSQNNLYINRKSIHEYVEGETSCMMNVLNDNDTMTHLL